MNVKRWAQTAAVAGFSVFSTSVFAHHGFAGRYDEETSITLQGTVVELQLVNPHAMLIFDVRDENGRVVRWNGLLGSATALQRAEGWTKDTLKPGDKVTVFGPPAVNGAPDMLLMHESVITLSETKQEVRNSLGTGRGQRGF